MGASIKGKCPGGHGSGLSEPAGKAPLFPSRLESGILSNLFRRRGKAGPRGAGESDNPARCKGCSLTDIMYQSRFYCRRKIRKPRLTAGAFLFADF
jgi:hypothetical protein